MTITWSCFVKKMAERDIVEKTTSILKNAIKELEDSMNGHSNAPSTSSIAPSTSQFGQRASENFRYVDK